MADSESATFPPLISREHAGNTIASALKIYVGHGRRKHSRHYTMSQLSEGTGIKERMIECAMHDPDAEDYRPLPAFALLSIMSFLGPDFASEVLAPAHLRALDADDEPVAKLELVRAQLLELAGKCAA